MAALATTITKPVSVLLADREVDDERLHRCSEMRSTGECCPVPGITRGIPTELLFPVAAAPGSICFPRYAISEVIERDVSFTLIARSHERSAESLPEHSGIKRRLRSDRWQTRWLAWPRGAAITPWRTV